MHRARPAPRKPRLIDHVAVSSSRVRAGESVLVTTKPIHQGTHVEIHGAAGDAHHLQFAGPPGPRTISVLAYRDGVAQRRDIHITVIPDPPGVPPLPILTMTPQRFQPRAARFGIANFAKLGLSQPQLIWDFGDTATTSGPVPWAIRDYTDSVARDGLYSSFHVKLAVFDGDRFVATAQRTIAVHNLYAYNKQRGVLTPRIGRDVTIQRAAQVYQCAFTVSNIEDEPITFHELRVETRHRDFTSLDVPGAPVQIEMTLPARSNTRQQLEIPSALIDHDMFGVVLHLRGSSASGTPATTNAYFEVRLPVEAQLGSRPLANLLDPIRERLGRDVIGHDKLEAVASSPPPAPSAVSTGIIYRNPDAPSLGIARWSASPSIQNLLAPTGPLRPFGNGTSVGDLCDPTNLPEPPPQGLSCQLTNELTYLAVPGLIVNAKKGDLVLSPGGQGFIGELLKQVTPPQMYSHSGMMIRNFDQVRHSTGSSDRILAHPVGTDPQTGEPQPTDGFDPDALKYVWPGTITQTIDNAALGEVMIDPDGVGYRMGTFGFDLVSTDGWTLIYPAIVKPAPEYDTPDVRSKLHAVAEKAKSIAGHYRFYAYTDPTIGLSPAGDEAPAWARGTYPTVCSSFIWLAAKQAGVQLESANPIATPNDLEPLDTERGAEVNASPDGLYYYTADERRAAAQWLYQYTYDTAYQKANWVGEALTGIADDIANQLCNAFASDWTDGDSKDSDDWKNTGGANAVSPDNLTFWDSPGPGNEGGLRGLWGAVEEAFYRPGRYEWVRISRWAVAHGPGTVRGRVLFQGEPVWKARVEVAGQTQYTNQDGTFVFATVPDGKYAITAGAQVGGAPFNRWASSSSDIEVRIGATTDAVMTLELPAEVNREIVFSANIAVAESWWTGGVGDVDTVDVQHYFSLHPFQSHATDTIEGNHNGIVGRLSISVDLKLDLSIDVTWQVQLIDDDGDEEGTIGGAMNVPADTVGGREGVHLTRQDHVNFNRMIQTWVSFTLANDLAQA